MKTIAYINNLIANAPMDGIDWDKVNTANSKALFEAWIMDGNVIEINDNVYSTHDTLWTNRLNANQLINHFKNL